MGGKTLTRADLAEAVYRKVGLSRTESAELVEAVRFALGELTDDEPRGPAVVTMHRVENLRSKQRVAF